MTALSVFNYFPQLPVELRLRVWELALPTQRFITLHLVDFAVQETPEKKRDTNDDGGAETTEGASQQKRWKPGSRRDIQATRDVEAPCGPNSQASEYFYTLHLPKPMDSSVLFRVSKEAAAVAAARYRLALRYRPTQSHSEGQAACRSAVLPLDPKTDTVYITLCDIGTGDQSTALLSFLWDCLVYDPRGLGLAHLAIPITTGHEYPNGLRRRQ
ncbi:uncharacterized protein B0I36DRAFT_361339 [Microdochium trichocladiopsis]|uniref:2EXR domain-containing protein n=1 Tax=Microdochium trichocladiopsis TaxID=1682393 RepID=A0A9P8YD29_9PEZI|nr:uncharacterized protein B0I36DRAFT_361339 [Microdochium trichocladiopsis]KAH7036037.1 hypothetical protein B0I36DRAFT_361339 [Microdochium trichocladiopsis]